MPYGSSQVDRYTTSVGASPSLLLCPRRGRETPIGVLHDDLSMGELYSEDAMGIKNPVNPMVTVLIGGSFHAAALPNLDANAETILGGSTDSNGVFSF